MTKWAKIFVLEHSPITAQHQSHKYTRVYEPKSKMATFFPRKYQKTKQLLRIKFSKCKTNDCSQNTIKRKQTRAIDNNCTKSRLPTNWLGDSQPTDERESKRRMKKPGHSPHPRQLDATTSQSPTATNLPPPQRYSQPIRTHYYTHGCVTHLHHCVYMQYLVVCYSLAVCVCVFLRRICWTWKSHAFRHTPYKCNAYNATAFIRPK